MTDELTVHGAILRWRDHEYEIDSVERGETHGWHVVVAQRNVIDRRTSHGDKPHARPAFRLAYRADGTLARAICESRLYKSETAEAFAAALSPHLLDVVRPIRAALGRGSAALDAARQELMVALRECECELARVIVASPRDSGVVAVAMQLTLPKRIDYNAYWTVGGQVRRLLNQLGTTSVVHLHALDASCEIARGVMRDLPGRYATELVGYALEVFEQQLAVALTASTEGSL